MVNDLRGVQIKILTYGIYALMFFLSVVMSWAAVQIVEMPTEYVRLERYTSDSMKGEAAHKRIENKLDRLIMQRSR